MKKHQFAKVDCNCKYKATNFKCKYCGAMEFSSVEEVRALKMENAVCTSPKAPDVPPQEKFRVLMGGTLDCLAPDYETFFKNAKE